MNFKEIGFCPTMDKLNTKVVSALLADGLFAGSEKANDLLAARYEQMKKNCGNVFHNDSRWDLDDIIADKGTPWGQAPRKLHFKAILLPFLKLFPFSTPKTVSGRIVKITDRWSHGLPMV